MKTAPLHRHLIEALIPVFQEIFQENRYADQVLERTFKAHRKWGSRDRKFFAEQVYDGVRWWRKYWFLSGQEVSFEKTPFLKFWAVQHTLKGHELPPWPEFENFSISTDKTSELENLRSVRESIPDWLDEQGFEEMGAQWESNLKALNEPATVDLRVNRLKTTRDQVLAELSSEGIEVRPIPELEDGLTLVQRKNVFSTKAFQSGLFEVQDRASQKVAAFLKTEPGLRVIDACAGGGGKSLHLAALMKNKGQIISMDVHEWKLKELRTRATRNGANFIETKVISPKNIQDLKASADRVLLDVPCSGVGVLRRNPDAKWKLKPETMKELRITQAQILKEYSEMTKPGGLLVYATCSFFPSENERQVEAFLKANHEWTIEEQIRINPDQGLGDGFFAARLKRSL